MKSLPSILLLAFFAALFCRETTARAAASLFPDKGLEAIVREELKKGDKEELKEDDLKNIYFLRGKGKKIANLAGIEKCVNVESVELGDNAIADLKPLAGLVNVQLLDLSQNAIVDVAPLAGLVKLQYLHLDGNRIEHIEPLKDLKKMMSLDLSRNKIKSLDALAGMDKLASLYLEGNRDLRPLAAQGTQVGRIARSAEQPHQ